MGCIWLGVTPVFIDLTETELEEMVNGFCTFLLEPDCKLGDDVIFLVNKAPAARAVVSRIEKFEGYRVFGKPTHLKNCRSLHNRPTGCGGKNTRFSC